MTPFDNVKVSGIESPDFLAGIASGLSVAGALAERIGAMLDEPCNDCDACRAVSTADRESMTAIAEANRMFAAELANALDDLSRDLMGLARMYGFVPPTRKPRHRG